MTAGEVFLLVSLHRDISISVIKLRSLAINLILIQIIYIIHVSPIIYYYHTTAAAVSITFSNVRGKRL